MAAGFGETLFRCPLRPAVSVTFTDVSSIVAGSSGEVVVFFVLLIFLPYLLYDDVDQPIGNNDQLFDFLTVQRGGDFFVV